MNQEKFNTRVLVIDDEEPVRDSFREILQPSQQQRKTLQGLADAEAELFDDEPSVGESPDVIMSFRLDEAVTGQRGLEMVRQACENDDPYAVIFVDMRMPGWDGLETVQHIRRIDSRAEIVFVTAYSDYSIQEIVHQAGKNVTYHCKPFSVEEIEQIATKAVYEWNKARNLEELIGVVADLRGQKWQMNSLLNNVLGQVSDILGCSSALVAVLQEGRFRKVAATGQLLDDALAEQSIKQHLVNSQLEERSIVNNTLCFRMDKYGVLALFDSVQEKISSEKIYLVRLFLEQVNSAVQNMELEDALLRQEKLSAVGQAVSMLSHDLRGPIGNVGALADMVKEQYEDKATAFELLGFIRQCSEDGIAIMNDVLDFVRNKEISRESVQLCAVVDQIRAYADDISKKFSVPVVYNVQGDGMVLLDVSKICRVVINLVRNAAEALQTAGTSSPEIRLDFAKTDASLQIVVVDNGPGIPVEIRDTLFVPFATYGKSGGTGLGLAIVKQFVEAHGGTITVESSQGGTVFDIELPLN